MAKWADYGISKVQYNKEKTQISKVLAHVDNGNDIAAGTEKTRQQVVTAIEGGTTYVTILKNQDGNWLKGQPVSIVTVNNVKYLRTDKNQTAKDNLENLPEV